MLTESMLIVPDRDNAGNDLSALRKHIEAEMVESFGGVTASPATGYWNSPKGEFFEEPVTRLISAAEDSPQTKSELRKLAGEVIADGQQEAAYVRFPNGRVEIVEKPKST